MCLSINKQFHPNYEPMTAKENLVVYKVLDMKRTTPFMRFPVKFIFKKARLKAKFEISFIYNPFNATTFRVVYQGIHAYLTLQRCEDLIRINAHISDNYTIHKAIIPKGTNYFIGIYDDIVAEKMIIYKKTLATELLA